MKAIGDIVYIIQDNSPYDLDDYDQLNYFDPNNYSITRATIQEIKTCKSMTGQIMLNYLVAFNYGKGEYTRKDQRPDQVFDSLESAAAEKKRMILVDLKNMKEDRLEQLEQIERLLIEND